MKTPARMFLVFILLLLFESTNLLAQWNMIAANVVPVSTQFGALHYKDGMLWAGCRNLSYSSNLGKTWTRSPLIVQTNDFITDINFFDKLNVLVATFRQGVYLTRDGGLTWKNILTATTASNLAFNGSPNIIHVLTEGDNPTPPGGFQTSTNGGLTWQASSAGGDFSTCFTIAKDKTIYVLVSRDPAAGLPGSISASTDLGLTWHQNTTEVDGDSFTMCADSCDAKRLYIANEDYKSTVNNLSELYYSTDGGNSRISAISFPPPYFSGSMACTSNVIYAGSLRKEVYRSTDQGVSWKSIGGPFSLQYDCRNIACIDDNTVFVLDDQGSIWETINSGGDSLIAGSSFNALTFDADSLFLHDSLLICDTSISRFIGFRSTGCNPPSIVNAEFLGADSLSYSQLSFSGDSLLLNFKPIFDSLNVVRLVLTLTDGTKKIITLAGFGIPRTRLALKTQDQKVDTLGNEVSIPFTVSGLIKPENVTLVIHYDTVLSYKGSFSPAGTQLDIPNEQWKGRSKLNIPNAIPDAIEGYARFTVFSDSIATQYVAFDSLSVPAFAPCENIFYTAPEKITSTITSVSGCGINILSRFLHHNELPELSIVPNPTIGDVSIISTMNLGEANMAIYDMLGIEQGKSTITLNKNMPAKLNLPVQNRVYFIRVNAIAGTYNLRVVVNR